MKTADGSKVYAVQQHPDLHPHCLLTAFTQLTLTTFKTAAHSDINEIVCNADATPAMDMYLAYRDMLVSPAYPKEAKMLFLRADGVRWLCWSCLFALYRTHQPPSN